MIDARIAGSGRIDIGGSVGAGLDDVLGTTLGAAGSIEEYVHHDYPSAVAVGGPNGRGGYMHSYGTLNSQIGFKNACWACFGVGADVISGDLTVWETWTIDVGPMVRIAAAQVGALGPWEIGRLSLWASDDNVTFHEVISAADFTAGIGPIIPGTTSNAVDSIIAGPFSQVAIAGPESGHRYWSLHADDYTTGGLRYYGGMDFYFVRLVRGRSVIRMRGSGSFAAES